MKVIHCADLHLDSKMNANLDKVRAKERKNEILNTFERMIQYAVQSDISAILIAGDMFDTKNISATAKNVVLSAIKNHSGIQFFYLKGNHGNDNFLSEAEELPENLKRFGEQWTSYSLNNNVVITGIELSPENTGSAYMSLMLDHKKFNIVMLHGQEAESSYSNPREKAEIIPMKTLRGQGIDYLALGHVHAYKKESLDARGTFCYPGCLEGRGFDECGDHGFVLLDIDEERGTYTHQFVPFAERKIFTVPVDVTDTVTTAEISDRVVSALAAAGCENKDMVKIVLEGVVDVACEKDVEYMMAKFSPEYYFVKIYDETVLKVDIEDYLLDESLKGEFVRMVMQENRISPEDQKSIIRYGLQAIAGEDIV